MSWACTASHSMSNPRFDISLHHLLTRESRNRGHWLASVNHMLLEFLSFLDPDLSTEALEAKVHRGRCKESVQPGESCTCPGGEGRPEACIPKGSCRLPRPAAVGLVGCRWPQSCCGLSSCSLGGRVGVPRKGQKACG